MKSYRHFLKGPDRAKAFSIVKAAFHVEGTLQRHIIHASFEEIGQAIGNLRVDIMEAHMPFSPNHYKIRGKRHIIQALIVLLKKKKINVFWEIQTNTFVPKTKQDQEDLEYYLRDLNLKYTKEWSLKYQELKFW